jgi:tetratricopeptide (TPR) repeat protein
LIKFLQITLATTCGALLFACPARAKMSGTEEEQYGETIHSAQALEKSKDWIKARAKYAEAREAAVRGQDKKKETQALTSFGAICLEQGDYPAAEATFKEALAIAEANTYVGDGQLASCLYDLSTVLIKEKRDSEAKPYFSRCIEISKRVFSTNHPSLAVRSGEYASLLTRLGDKEEGAKLANQSQDIVNSFMDDMCGKIKKAWQPTLENFSYRLGVSYEVLNHGKVGKVEVTQSSGSATADKAGIDAVKAASPFSDITCTDPEDKLFLAFSFDYNHLNKGPHAAAPKAGPHATASRQSKEVQAESDAKLKEEKAKSDKLKEQIDSLLIASPDDSTGLAALYVQYCESLTVQGEQAEAVGQYKKALDKDCFKDLNNTPTISLLIGLGHTYLNAPSLGDAEATLKEAISGKSFGQVPLKLRQEALEDYGNCLCKRHKFAEAQDYYTRARELKE